MALNGTERLMVYGGPATDDDGGPTGSTWLTTADLLTAAPNTLELIRTGGGGPSITVAAFLALDGDDTEVRVGLLSGGASITRADYEDYASRATAPGITTGISVVKAGQGYIVGQQDTVEPEAGAEADDMPVFRVLEIDQFGAIKSAVLIRPGLIDDGRHPTANGDQGAEFFVTTRRDAVDNVIQSYSVEDGGSGWMTGDTVSIPATNVDGEAASGVIYQTTPQALPDLELISVYKGETAAITSGTQGTGVVLVAGDKTAHLPIGRRVTIGGSTGNNGTYYLSAVSFTSAHTSLTLKGRPKGTITLSDLPSAADTVTVNDQQTFTFRSSAPGPHEVLIGADITVTATNLKNAILTWIGEVEIGDRLNATSALGVVTVQYLEADVPNGEDVTLAKSGTNIAVSGAHLVAPTALPNAVMDGSIIIGPEIVFKANNEGDTLSPDNHWRFTNVFNEDDHIKRLDEIVVGYAPAASGDAARPDEYTLYISPYSSGDQTVLTTVDLTVASGNQIGAAVVVDLYVFGTMYDTGDSPFDADDFGTGTGLTIAVTSTLSFNP